MGFNISAINQFGPLKLVGYKHFLASEYFVSEIMQRWAALCLSKSHFLSSAVQMSRGAQCQIARRRCLITVYALVLAKWRVISFHFHLCVGVSFVNVVSVLKVYLLVLLNI